MIREMQISDLDAVLKIEEANFEHPWSKPMFLDEFKKNISHRQVFQPEKNDAIAFSIGWKILDEYHLGNIAVADSHKRQGVALQLLSNIESLEAIKQIQLEVSQKNLAAISFYEKNGFMNDGLRKNYYQDCSDALLMLKIIR